MIAQHPEVLYVDEHLAAVLKPAGELVHPGWARGEPTSMARLRDHLGERVHPVHRLDRATSGVLLFARTSDVARRLGEAWQAGSVRKRYVALVRGVPAERGQIDHPVRRDESGDERVEALTRFERIAISPVARCSLVAAEPVTGRLHQIRRHFKHASHPLVGDVRYGKGDVNRAFRADWGVHRLALHAAALHLLHPVSGTAMSIEAPLPADLAGPLRALGVWEA